MSVSQFNSHDPYVCPNCQANAQGLACSNCGQRRIAEEELSFKHALSSLFNEIYKLDGRLFLTLKLLLAKPGQLTVDFLQGRRGQQIHPLKLYLTVVPFFFILIQHSIFTLPQLIKYEPQHPLSTVIERHAAKHGAGPVEYIRQRDARFQASFKTFDMVITFAVFAPLLWVLFHGRLKYLGHHLVMAFHFATFTAIVGCVVHLLLMQHINGIFLSGVQNLLNLAYLIPAAHRVYGESWPATIVKCVVFILVDQLAVALSLGTSVLIALFT